MVIESEGLHALGIEQRLCVSILLYPPDRRVRDLDNYFKALLDALTHTNLWLDDSQIDELRIVRGEVKKGGECLVRISEIGDCK